MVVICIFPVLRSTFSTAHDMRFQLGSFMWADAEWQEEKLISVLTAKCFSMEVEHHVVSLILMCYQDIIPHPPLLAIPSRVGGRYHFRECTV